MHLGLIIYGAFTTIAPKFVDLYFSCLSHTIFENPKSSIIHLFPFFMMLPGCRSLCIILQLCKAYIIIYCYLYTFCNIMKYLHRLTLIKNKVVFSQINDIVFKSWPLTILHHKNTQCFILILQFLVVLNNIWGIYPFQIYCLSNT